MASIIQLKDVTVTVRPNNGHRITILKNVSFDIDRSEIVAVMGPSGSGKSTLLHAMSGLIPSEGDIELDGIKVNKLSRTQAAAWRLKNVGFVFQAFYLQSYLTVIQNIITPGSFASIPKQDVMQRAMGLLERLGMSDKAERYPDELSGGEMQRVAIARAMVCTPMYVFADEPTGNLDATNAAHIIDSLLEMRKLYGATIIIVTHSPSVASRCDRVVYMKDGAIYE